MPSLFTERLSLYVSKEEKEEIKRRAAACGKSVSRYLAHAGVYFSLIERSEVVGWEGVAERLERLFEELAQTNREVRRLEVRVHQVARQIDTQQRQGDPANFDEMNALRDEIGSALKAIQDAMGTVAEVCP